VPWVAAGLDEIIERQFQGLTQGEESLGDLLDILGRWNPGFFRTSDIL
jgi:hypothetical protein